MHVSARPSRWFCKSPAHLIDDPEEGLFSMGQKSHEASCSEHNTKSCVLTGKSVGTVVCAGLVPRLGEQGWAGSRAH